MTRELDEQYWSQRYRQQETGWDIGAVSAPLQAYFDQLTNKNISILIPGAGNAHEAEYLLNQGFKNVYVCDLAREPLRELKKRCPAINPALLLHGNFFELQELCFDLIVEQTFFCAIPPSLRKTYFEKMHALLRPGGRLVGLLFSEALNAGGPPFGGSKEEYLGYLGEGFRIHTFGPCYNSIKPRQGRELFINLVRKETRPE